MKLNYDNQNKIKPADSADIAYLLLIFIIILSLIGTDNLTGIKLPSSESTEKPLRQSVRIITTNETFYANGKECNNEEELKKIITESDKNSGFIIVGDKNCSGNRIKTVIRCLNECNCEKISFMTNNQ